MSGLMRLHHYTYAEYLALEAASSTKHEFLDGEIYAMAGGTPRHAALSMAVGASLSVQLAEQPCRAYSSDLRVRVAATGLATYPDVTVVCGEVITDSADAHAVINPTIVVEVLSDGTANYDRGEKLAHYQQIPSLRAIVLVSHTDTVIDVHRREDDTWVVTSSQRGETADLGIHGLTLDVATIYDAAGG